MKTRKSIWIAAVLTAVAGIPQFGASQETAATDAAGLSHAFVDVSVLPMDSERILPGQTVIVTDGRIERMGAAADVNVPDGATAIDGSGKFLVPGVAEMHGHYPNPQAREFTEAVMYLYVANGVTLVRGMQAERATCRFGTPSRRAKPSDRACWFARPPCRGTMSRGRRMPGVSCAKQPPPDSITSSCSRA